MTLLALNNWAQINNGYREAVVVDLRSFVNVSTVNVVVLVMHHIFVITDLPPPRNSRDFDTVQQSPARSPRLLEHSAIGKTPFFILVLHYSDGKKSRTFTK